MKPFNQFLTGVTFIAMLCLTFVSCAKKDHPEKLTQGKLKLNIGITINEKYASGQLKTGTDDFSVQIFNTSNKPVISYAHASDIPDLLELTEGSYYAVAASDNSQAVAFENPYYQGNSGTFTITSGQTSTVTITCSLANIMVTVVYTDRVISSFDNFNTIVSNSSDSLVFAKTETRAGFFNSGPLHIKSNLYLKGETIPSKILTQDIADPQPGKHYEIHVDAQPVGGSTLINLTLNDAVTTEIINVTDTETGNGLPVFGDVLITEIMYNQ